jgi:hypothetical protein
MIKRQEVCLGSVLKEIVLFSLEGFLPGDNIGLFSICLFSGLFLGSDDLPRSFAHPLRLYLNNPLGWELLEDPALEAIP